MSTFTTKYGIIKPSGTDDVADGDDTMRALVDRIDLLMGEGGTDSITPSGVNATTTKRVNYARSYAALAPLVPQAMARLDASAASTDTFHIWTSGEDATGFTLNIRASSVTARAVKWNCRAV